MQFTKKSILILGVIVACCLGFIIGCENIITEIFVSKDKLFEPVVKYTLSEYQKGIQKDFEFEIKYAGNYEVGILVKGDYMPWDKIAIGKKPRISVKLSKESGEILAKGNSDYLFNKGARGGSLFLFKVPKDVPKNENINCKLTYETGELKCEDYYPEIFFWIERLSFMR